MRNPFTIEAQLLAWAASKVAMPNTKRPLTKTEKLVLVALAANATLQADRRIYARMRVTEFAAEALCSELMARSATKTLTSARLLYAIMTRESHGGLGANRYYFPLFEEAITGKPFVVPDGKPTFK